MRIFRPLALAAALALAGCHSAHIDATISNRTNQPLTLIEVDYPSASFGTQTLAPGGDFHYRFKVLGSGPTTVQWTDAATHDHKSTGPTLHENDEGALTILVNPAGDVVWSEQFTNP
jgi:hypothetical protein